MTQTKTVTVGVLALQGAFIEHVKHLQVAAKQIKDAEFSIIEVRTVPELESCDALVLPGGESTAISLVAERTGMLQPLRDFVKKQRKPVWGTCAGMILLAEEATRTKRDGQELIGGLDVRVIRNHFGRQAASFTTKLDLAFMGETEPFQCVFIRAPVVDVVIDNVQAKPIPEGDVIAPSVKPADPAYQVAPVKILATIPASDSKSGKDTIVAVEQGNVVGTSFHPELTEDVRLHKWWLEHRVLKQ